MAVEKYPGKRYHAKKEPVYVQNAEEDAALGPGWFDDPAKANPPKAEPPKAQ